MTIATCVPADPASEGGSEATVKLAKADLVPTSANLLDGSDSLAEQEAACAAFCAEVNARPHRVTRRPPVELLAEERARLYPLPAAYTLAFGATRTVGTASPMVTFEHGQYSVPHRLAGQVVWVRAHGEQVVVVHVGASGPVEVARHARTSPGRPRVEAAHFPPNRPVRWRAPHERAPPTKPRSWRWVTARWCGSPRPPPRAPPGSGPRWPTRWRSPSSATRRASAGRSATPPSPAGSTKLPGRDPRLPGDRHPGPARRAAEHASLAQGTAGWSRLDPAAATVTPAKVGGDQ